MIIKEILNEKLLTLAETKDILNEVKEQRNQEQIELGYELRRAISHADTFTKIDSTKSLKLIEDLLKLEKMKPEIAYRLADIMPLSFDEIRSVYAKERFTLTETELSEILDIITAAY